MYEQIHIWLCWLVILSPALLNYWYVRHCCLAQLLVGWMVWCPPQVDIFISNLKICLWYYAWILKWIFCISLVSWNTTWCVVFLWAGQFIGGVLEGGDVYLWHKDSDVLHFVPGLSDLTLPHATHVPATPQTQPKSGTYHIHAHTYTHIQMSCLSTHYACLETLKKSKITMIGPWVGQMPGMLYLMYFMYLFGCK